VEINEKVNAVFNVSGFAIYIKVSGMLLIKNYVHNHINLRLQFNEEFQVSDEQKFGQSLMGSTYASSNLQKKKL
jgi:hypothetical protein